MSEPTFPGSGRFVWRELMTRDMEAARRFYTELLGWTARGAGMEGVDYTLFAAQGVDVAGMGGMPPGDLPAHWVGYVGVGDVDATVARLEAAGGETFMPPTDIPTVGRVAIAADAQGAIFGLLRGLEADPPVPERMAVGLFCWDTLMTPAAPGAIGFYQATLGWEAEQSGALTMLTFDQLQLADLQPAQGAQASWLPYVFVGDVAAARARAQALGGQILMPHVPVPGVGAFAVIQDPTGALMGLFGDVAFPQG